MFCCLRTCFNVNVLRKNPATANRFREPEIHLDAAHMGPDVILLSNNLRITGSGGAIATAPLVQSKSYFEVKIQHKGCWSIGLATQQADLSSKFGGSDKESWCLCSDNTTRHNNEEFRPVVATTTEPTTNKSNNTTTLADSSSKESGFVGLEDVLSDDVFLADEKDSGKEKSSESGLSVDVNNPFPDEGDIVGVSFDHIELNFYFNGKNLEIPFRNVKGSALYPVIYVGNGSILDLILDNFHYGPPAGFDRIMLEQSLL